MTQTLPAGVAASFYLAEQHWADFQGVREGKVHADLLEAYRTNTAAATRHLRRIGRSELQALGETMELIAAAITRIGEPA